MQPKTALLLFVGLLFTVLATTACSQGNTARAELKDANGKVVGEAIFVAAEEAGGVEVTLNVHDLPPGVHGVHVHDVGRCDPPGFTSAGGHFNPDGKQHGLENPNGPHNGDLPDFTVAADGSGALIAENPRLQGLGEGQNLFAGDGVALVVHAGPDDQKTDPSGDSGVRIACGVMLHD
jgi:superoxide dismutase, Cu-Zn family